jgi:oxygen-dependent protoporphyrinogen oxidase
VAAPLLRGLDAELGELVASIASAPVSVVCLGYREADVAHVPRGFGFLVPGREKLGVLGTLFDTWVFPQRSPDGRVLWRTLIGGARDPGAIDLDDAALVARARSALHSLLHLTAVPEMTYVVRHRRGIPHYTLGHVQRVARIEERLRRQPGLHIAGNSYRGIAMNACIQSAEALAGQLAGAPVVSGPP